MLATPTSTDREIHAPMKSTSNIASRIKCKAGGGDGGGVYFALFLGSDNSHTTPNKY